MQQVRQTELPGETVWRPGVCRQCAAACGIQVRVVDRNAKKIEGNEAHPGSRGGVCALGHSLLQELYNPDRILQPQQLAGTRGEGAFQPASWDDALAAAQAAISGASGGGIAIVGSDGTGLAGHLLRRFAAALGAPAPTFLEAPEAEVESAAPLSWPSASTTIPTSTLPDTELVISIGAPFLDRWRSPCALHPSVRRHAARSGHAPRPPRPGRGQDVSYLPRTRTYGCPSRPGTGGHTRPRPGRVTYWRAETSATAARQRYEQLFPSTPPTLDEAATECDVRLDRLEEVAEELASTENASGHRGRIGRRTHQRALQRHGGTRTERPAGQPGPARRRLRA